MPRKAARINRGRRLACASARRIVTRKGRRMSVKKLHDGELIALRRPAEVRAESGTPDLSSADLSNVIPFARPRAMRPAPEVAPPGARANACAF
jgi:hypothetical protein